MRSGRAMTRSRTAIRAAISLACRAIAGSAPRRGAVSRPAIEMRGGMRGADRRSLMRGMAASSLKPGWRARIQGRAGLSCAVRGCDASNGPRPAARIRRRCRASASAMRRRRRTAAPGHIGTGVREAAKSAANSAASLATSSASSRQPASKTRAASEEGSDGRGCMAATVARPDSRSDREEPLPCPAARHRGRLRPTRAHIAYVPARQPAPAALQGRATP